MFIGRYRYGVFFIILCPAHRQLWPEMHFRSSGALCSCIHLYRSCCHQSCFERCLHHVAWHCRRGSSSSTLQFFHAIAGRFSFNARAELPSWRRQRLTVTVSPRNNTHNTGTFLILPNGNKYLAFGCVALVGLDQYTLLHIWGSAAIIRCKKMCFLYTARVYCTPVCIRVFYRWKDNCAGVYGSWYRHSDLMEWLNGKIIWLFTNNRSHLLIQGSFALWYSRQSFLKKVKFPSFQNIIHFGQKSCFFFSVHKYYGPRSITKKKKRKTESVSHIFYRKFAITVSCSFFVCFILLNGCILSSLSIFPRSTNIFLEYK